MKTPSPPNATPSGGGDIAYPSSDVEEASSTPPPVNIAGVYSLFTRPTSPGPYSDKSAYLTSQTNGGQPPSPLDQIHVVQQGDLQDVVCTDEDCMKKHAGCTECDSVEIQHHVCPQNVSLLDPFYQPPFNIMGPYRPTSPPADSDTSRRSTTSQHSQHRQKRSWTSQQSTETRTRSIRSPRAVGFDTSCSFFGHHDPSQDEVRGENFDVSANRPSGSTVDSMNYDSQQSHATNTSHLKDASSRTNRSSRDSRSSITGHSQRPTAGNGGYGEERIRFPTQYHRDSSRKPSRHHSISAGPTPMPKPNAINTEKYEVASGRHEHMYHDEGDDENAFVVLMRMPILLPIGIFLCFYALFLCFFLLVIFPLRFCPPSEFVSSRVGFRGQVCRALGPVFCFSMRVVYASETSSRYKQTFGEKDVEAAGGNGATRRTSTTKHATSATTASKRVLSSADSSLHTEMTPNMIVYGGSTYKFKHASMLLFAGIMFPFLLFPLFNAVWIAACFWMFSIILSDFDDGRAFVLALRDCWIRLVKSLITIERCP